VLLTRHSPMRGPVVHLRAIQTGQPATAAHQLSHCRVRCSSSSLLLSASRSLPSPLSPPLPTHSRTALLLYSPPGSPPLEWRISDANRFKQVYHAFRLCRRLKQTFIYLAAYFFLGDCLNTVGEYFYRSTAGPPDRLYCHVSRLADDAASANLLAWALAQDVPARP
jgi:hypothetical protein